MTAALAFCFRMGRGGGEWSQAVAEGPEPRAGLVSWDSEVLGVTVRDLKRTICQAPVGTLEGQLYLSQHRGLRSSP